MCPCLAQRGLPGTRRVSGPPSVEAGRDMAATEPRGGEKAKGTVGAKTARLRWRFPTIDDLRRRARWRVPRFAFDFVDGGANDEACVERNRTAFPAVELVPRARLGTKGASPEGELFGSRYAAPRGIAPIGSPGLL